MRHQEKVLRSFTKVLLAFLLCFGWVCGQEKRDPDRGFIAGGSYALSDIETINTTNGNLMLNIPLASLPAGRGPAYTFALRYNSKLWDSKGTRNTDGVHPETGEPYYFNLEEPTPSDKGGWAYSSFYSLEVIHRYDLEPIPESCETPGPDYAKPRLCMEGSASISRWQRARVSPRWATGYLLRRLLQRGSEWKHLFP